MQNDLTVRTVSTRRPGMVQKNQSRNRRTDTAVDQLRARPSNSMPHSQHLTFKRQLKQNVSAAFYMQLARGICASEDTDTITLQRAITVTNRDFCGELIDTTPRFTRKGT